MIYSRLAITFAKKNNKVKKSTQALGTGQRDVNTE